MGSWDEEKNEKEIPKSNASRIFKEWSGVTTAHGFLDLSQAKTLIGRIIWTVLIAVSLVIMCNQVSNAIRDFAGHQWATTMKEKPSDDTGLNFPSVIICNANRLKWSKAKQYGLTMEMVQIFFRKQLTENMFEIDYMVNSSIENEFLDWVKKNNFTYMKFFDELAPTCDDFFFDCNFYKGEYNITPIQTYEFGRCYKLETNKKQSIVGSQYGISFILDTQSWDYVPTIYNNYMYEGLMLQLQYEGRVEFGEWIKLNPGTHNTVTMQAFENTVRQNEKSFLNPFALLESKPPCTKTPKLSFSDASQYSKSNCIRECEMYYITQGVCMPYKQNEQYRICEFDELFSILDEFRNATAEQEHEIFEQCIANCGKPCYRNYVQTHISTTMFPSEQQRPKLQEWITARNIQHVLMNDVIMLEIFFTSVDTTLAEYYEVMSLDNLISSSGGLLGLWAGMSFLTIFQALAYFFKYIETKIMKFKRESTNDKKEVVTRVITRNNVRKSI